MASEVEECLCEREAVHPLTWSSTIWALLLLRCLAHVTIAESEYQITDGGCLLIAGVLDMNTAAASPTPDYVRLKLKYGYNTPVSLLLKVFRCHRCCC